MSGGTDDPLVQRALDLLALGVDGFKRANAVDFLSEVERRHEIGPQFRKATSEAVSRCGIADPVEISAEVYANFLWTHFAAKFLMTASPILAVGHFHAGLDMTQLRDVLAQQGSAILSSFHCTGYPLVALGLATSSAAPIISKARKDFLDESPARFSDRVVYMSDRSAAVKMTRALRNGTSVWIMLDVVLPETRVVRTRFLDCSLDVSAGIGAIARLSGRPCVPISWTHGESGIHIGTGTPITCGDQGDDRAIQEFVSGQATMIARRPGNWLEWYSVLEDSAHIRREVKKANERIWKTLTDHAPLWRSA